MGYIGGYVAAGANNSTSGYPGGLIFKTKAIDSNAPTGVDNTLSTRMVIDAIGNVGIGTSSPGAHHTAKLEVAGNIKGTKIWTNTIQAYVEGNVAGGAHLYIGGNGGNGSWNNYVFFGSGNAYITARNGDIHTATGIFIAAITIQYELDTNLIVLRQPM